MRAVRATMDFRFTLYGGAAGPGKTHTLVAWAAWMVAYYAMHGFRARVVLTSSDKERVVERFAGPLEEILVENGMGQIIGGAKDRPAGFRFCDPSFGAIWFAGLGEARSKLKGWPDVVALGIDELTEIDEETFHAIYWRLRFAKPGNPMTHQPILSTSNPDGPGAWWVKEYFVTKTFQTALGENIKKQFGDQFAYVPGKLSDNPNPVYAAEYEQTLSALPEYLRRARLEGQWDAAQGARFPWAPKVITWGDEKLPGGRIPAHWHVYSGLDWGNVDPCSCLWAAFDEQGNCYVFRSYYESGNTITRAAQKVKERQGALRVQLAAADPSMFARSPVENRHLASYFGAEDVGIQLIASTNDHAITNAMIEKYMEPDNGYPDLYFIEDECTELVRDIQAVRFDKEATNPENLVPHLHTHTVYALGYLLHKAWPLVRPPEPTHDALAAARAKEYERKWKKELKLRRRR